MAQFEYFDLITVLPGIIILGAAIILLLVGAWKGNNFMPAIGNAAMIGLIAAAIVQLLIPQEITTAFSGMFISNLFTSFTKILVIIGSVLSIFLANGYYKKNPKYMVAEFPVLILLATAGMVFMISANDLLSLYMALELQSLALYILASINRNNIKSSEAGLKYFVLGALASGIMLYGISLVYGFAGSTNFSKLSLLYLDAHSHAVTVGVIVGLVLIVIGLCFKVSAAPFHMWTPDVYEGAPLPVTSFFAVAPKVASLSLFVSVLCYPFKDLNDKWMQIIVLISALSMIIGAFGALRQTNIKRLMAYSSIGNVGYILVGLASGGIRDLLIYLFIYMLGTIGMFACIMMLKQKESSSEDIYSFSGLAKHKPYLAMAIAIILFSLAGIPPFAGFFGKFFIFNAAVEAGQYGLAIIGVLSSVVAAFYYLRIIKIMYFDEATSVVERDAPYEMKIVVFLAALFSLLFFIYFTPLVNLAAKAELELYKFNQSWQGKLNDPNHLRNGD